MKGNNKNTSKEIFNNLIQDVARKLDKITVHEVTLVSEICKMKRN